MEIGLAILLFICMTALLYVILSLKITRQVDLQMKEFYKTRIHQDMQEFYRDMEGYAAHFESQIQRLRTLSERAETAPVPQPEPQPEVMAQPRVEKAGKIETRKKVPLKKEPLRAEKNTKKAQPAKVTPQAKAMPKKSAASTPPVRPTPVQKPLPVAESAPAIAHLPENNDIAIAEELMKDLFPKDELNISNRPQATAARSVAAPAEKPAETEGEKTMSNFFSRLGRAIEPVIFGEKHTPGPAPEISRNLAAEPAGPASPAQQKATSNFSEVLKRAEQIKAEKKAERERSEIEARAEFYAQGDSFAPQDEVQAGISRVSRARAEIQETAPLRASIPVRPEPRRNALVVKELDQHTVNFLIDSLVKDNGYRRQALRALTENNIPLAEIARLSKIDIGELELMRQLGRF